MAAPENEQAAAIIIAGHLAQTVAFAAPGNAEKES
jgi:hypothetical protein